MYQMIQLDFRSRITKPDSTQKLPTRAPNPQPWLYTTN